VRTAPNYLTRRDFAWAALRKIRRRIHEKKQLCIALQPSLMRRRARRRIGRGSLNQLINVAVAEKVSALRTRNIFKNAFAGPTARNAADLDRAGREILRWRATNFHEIWGRRRKKSKASQKRTTPQVSKLKRRGKKTKEALNHRSQRWCLVLRLVLQPCRTYVRVSLVPPKIKLIHKLPLQFSPIENSAKLTRQGAEYATPSNALEHVLVPLRLQGRRIPAPFQGASIDSETQALPWANMRRRLQPRPMLCKLNQSFGDCHL